MADVERRKPYIWVSWLSPLLGGDKHCRYALWVKAHYQHEKRPDSGAADLDLWKGNHERFMATLAGEHYREGWLELQVEDQARFTVRGQSADVAGCPDLVARRPGVLAVVDGKTGRVRAGDWWQVAVYMLFGVKPREGERVVGTVEYQNPRTTTPVALTPETAPTVKAAVLELIRQAAAPEPPVATPSAGECSLCDIATCRFRAKAEDPARELKTEEF